MGNLATRLAHRLKALRGETPQYLFARRLGLSKSTLNRLEQAQQNVTLATLETLCRCLKCDISDLFAEKTEEE